MIENPKPSGPDPEAVRRALAEMDEARREFRDHLSDYRAYIGLLALFANRIEPAARAWLSQQDGEASN